MKDDEKKVLAFVQYRSTASLLGVGWAFVLDNIWSLLRLSWPVLLLYALLGGVTGVLDPAVSLFGLQAPLFALADVLLFIIFVCFTAIIVWQRHHLGYFPAAKAWVVVRDGASDGLHRFGRLLKLALRRPRRWGLFLAVGVMGLFVCLLISLVGSLPFIVIMQARLLAGASVAMGDTVFLPASLPWLSMAAGAVSAVVFAITLWFLFMPMAFTLGRLRFEEQDEQLPESPEEK